MKLGTLRDGTRDGVLVMVSRDLKLGLPADHVAPTLQAALDDWDYIAPQLQSLYEELNRQPSARAFEIDFTRFAAPLPRAFQWADASAYINHMELVRKARGAEMPENAAAEPLMYQGGSDALLGPRDDIAVENEDWGIDLEGEVAVITGDVPMGVKRENALEYVRLLMLANDVSLRNLIAGEMAGGFGFFQSKPATAFSPVALTPEELGAAWRGGKLHLPLAVHVNGELLGSPDAGLDMTFGFAKLIARAARTRVLSAGTIIGSGTVSNRTRSAGPACLAEKRAIEAIGSGEAKTPYLKFGDRIRIEMTDAGGQSLFGAIEQQVVQHQPQR
ncbi:MAG: fumarylacetoacetate hydrolase family protein [Betaproteobacteria bacterium]|nr:fumarylacetoacetate hydrolase family protein [Betaproteobacteria bacterium]